MHVDDGWLVITAVYALVAIISIVLVTAGLVYLFLKVKRLARLGKALPKLAKDRSQVTGNQMRDHGRRLTERARRTGAVLRASLNAIKGVMDETGKIVARQPVGGPRFLRRLAGRRRRGGAAKA